MSAKYNTVKVAVIGCGNWGQNLIRVFQNLGSLYAICDIDPSKAMAFSEKTRVPSMEFADILASPEIDAVVISTPSRTHEDLARLCLEANKHVFIEKPLALGSQAAIQLSQLAKLRGRIMMVGHLLQYHGAFNKLKQLNQNGTLGNLRYLTSHRSNFGKFPSETSVLWDYAPHDVSMVLALVGEMPHLVSASGGNHLQHTTLDTISFHLHFPSNKQAHIFVSWLYPIKEQKLTVIGDKAMAIFEDRQPWESKLKLHYYPEKWQDGLPHPFLSEAENIAIEPSEPLLHECQHFLDAILHHTQPLTNALEGANVIMVLEAAMLALETHHPVELPLISPTA